MVERKRHPHDFFNREEKERILKAIRSAEKDTSGEICFHLDRRADGYVMDRAKIVFQRHGLHRRKHRNAVLIYVLLTNRSFAILGDEGIHRHVGDDFWKRIVESLQHDFSRGEFLPGLEHAINEVGKKLKDHCPLST